MWTGHVVMRVHGFWSRPRVWVLWGVALLAALLPLGAESFLFSSGTRGKVYPCASCPKQKAAGGWLYAAPIVRAHLRASTSAVWLDVGNAFTGGDVTPDRLFVLTETYAQLGVSALNIAAGDFRHGFEFLHTLVAESEVPVVSANVVWADSRERVFPARVRVGARKPALQVIGLMEPPAGLDLFPQLREQFEGVEVLDPAAALRAQLKEVPDGAPVGVLYHGSADGLRALLRVADTRTEGRMWIAAPATAVATLRVGDTKTRLIPVPDDGKSFARFVPEGDPEIESIPVTPDAEPDPAILKRLRDAGVPEPGSVPVGTSGNVEEEGPNLQEIEAGDPVSFTRSAANRGLRLAVHGIRLRDAIGEASALPESVSRWWTCPLKTVRRSICCWN